MSSLLISLSGHLGVLVFLLVVWVFLVALSLPKFDSLSGGPCKASVSFGYCLLHRCFLLAAACISWDESRHLIRTPSSAAMYCKQKALSMRYTLTSASFWSIRRDPLESFFLSTALVVAGHLSHLLAAMSEEHCFFTVCFMISLIICDG